jgi:hypothetical protein
MRNTLVGFIAILTLFVLPSAANAASPRAVFQQIGGDFSAFYCSGKAALAHRNPYLVEPLRSCENAVQPKSADEGGVVTPSPLPGYDLVLFAGLAHLPYELAKAVWYAGLLISIGVATFCLARLTGFPTAFVLLVVVPVDGILNLSFGQVPPIVVAALSVAAYLIERRRYVTAALAAAVTLIEPHIGAPACLAMLLFFPGCRLTFGGLAVVFVGASLSVGGLAQNVSYFATHLPAQARSEIVAADQFSLTSVLHLLRIPDTAALIIGSFSYVAMAAAGIWLARYAARAYSSDAFVVVLPAAAVLFGGAYIHDVQFAAVLPAALLLCSKDRERFSVWLVLGLLIVPWFTFGTGGHTIGIFVRLICALAIGWMAILATERRRSIKRSVAVISALALFVSFLAIASVMPHRSEPAGSVIPAQFLAPLASAQDNWGAYLRATPTLSTTTAREEFEKLPFWLGLLGLLLLAADAPIRAVNTVASKMATKEDALSESARPASPAAG